MHQHPDAILDTSVLPASKAELKSVLRLAWQMHGGAEERAVIEKGYRYLARFQEGVGGAIIRLGNAAGSGEDETAKRWRAKAETEAIELAAEFEDFKRRCRKS